MRYEIMRLMQLVFALSVMFGAFAAGLAVGWLRWGRRQVHPEDDPTAGEVPRLVKPDLFSPADRRIVDDERAALPPPLPPRMLLDGGTVDAEVVEVDLRAALDAPAGS